MIIPYVGAGILIVFSIVFLVYARSVLGIAGKSLSFAYFAHFTSFDTFTIIAISYIAIFWLSSTL
jgi:hypothetical protein